MRKIWVVLILAFVMFIGWSGGSGSAYEITIILLEHEQSVPGIEVFYDGIRHPRTTAGFTDWDGSVTMGSLSNRVNVYFALPGYDEPVHLLTTDKGGTFWVSAVPIGAPGIYVDWEGQAEEGYDIMTVDWYCEDNAEATYWAVFNWDGGYAGFQETGEGRRLLMSLWELDDGTEPTVHYAWNGQSGYFDHEGEGAFVVSQYAWQPQTWYTMRIQHWVEDGKSYYSQWIKKKGGEWLNTAVIGYPKIGPRFYNNSMFQEDWAGNNLWRSCRLKNMYARRFETEIWDSLSDYIVSTAYIPVLGHSDSTPDTVWLTLWDYVFWDITYGVDWHLNSEESYIWIRNGGTDFTPGDKQIPITYRVNQPSWPEDANWFFQEKIVVPFAGGSGSVDDPYLIATAEQLDKIRDYPFAHFRQINDISLADYGQGEGWLPIGYPDAGLTGSFDGNSYQIADLVINRPNTEHSAGLFGTANILKNVDLRNVSVVAKDYCGALAGTCNEIINCSVTGSVKGGTFLGGLVGMLCNYALGCSFEGSVLSKNGYGIGGIAGFCVGEVRNSYADAVIEGSLNVGGLVGWLAEAGLVANSSAQGKVTAGSNVGGLIGHMNEESCARLSWAAVNVTATESGGCAGGFVGETATGNVIENCFATGEVDSPSIAGGFVGTHHGEIRNSYAIGKVRTNRGGMVGGFAATTTLYDGERAGVVIDCFYDSNTTGRRDRNKGLGTSTLQMQKEATFKNWDFVSIWEITKDESYPTLKQ